MLFTLFYKSTWYFIFFCFKEELWKTTPLARWFPSGNETVSIALLKLIEDKEIPFSSSKTRQLLNEEMPILSKILTSFCRDAGGSSDDYGFLPAEVSKLGISVALQS